ncbi:hypothetical protein ACIP1G_04410 [Pseudomonas sp. NPDC089392]|uniref:hypothetical protein n=1 Tax=Pseudomonas sp. NPDC089392 TaxID=3364459 RepID=UPI00382C26AE
MVQPTEPLWRLVSNAMTIFFEGITQHVDLLAAQPEVASADDGPNKYFKASRHSAGLSDELDGLVRRFRYVRGSNPSPAISLQACV